MRLIDKDALEEAVQGSINIMEARGISVIAASVPLAIIKGAPTIDAISVEWLKNKREYNMSRNWDLVDAIDDVLKYWKQEKNRR